jgi:hypothetical protein
LSACFSGTVGDLDAAVVLAVAESSDRTWVQPSARDASMMAASQYESWKRCRASSAAIMIALVMS